MLKVPDPRAALQHIVRRAMAVFPHAPRGSLLLREGDRLVVQASVGFSAPRQAPSHTPAGDEPARNGDLLSLETAPDAAGGVNVVAARAWYQRHLPPAAEADGGVPEGAGVLVAPIQLHGEQLGYLAVEQPTLEPPSDDRLAILEILADAAGEALDRNRLYDDKARSAQEIRLFEQLISALGTTAALHDLIEIIAHGIKSVQLDPDWKVVELWTLAEDSLGDGPAPARGDRRARVYRAPPSEPTSYFQNIRAGAVSAGRPLGIAVDFRTGHGGQGEGSQLDLLDEAIRRRVAGIVIASSSPEAAEEAFRRAAEVAIPVIAIDTPPIPGSAAQLYIGTDNVAAGRMAAEMMKRLLPGGGVVAALGATGLAANVRERVEGFCAALLGSNLTVLPPITCDWALETGIRLGSAALERRPDIAGAFGAAADNGPSWGLAARRLGRSGDLKIVGFDLIAGTVALLRRGEIHATLVQREYDMGLLAVEVIHRMRAQGIAPTLAALPPSRVLHTGVEYVTLERTPWSTALGDYLALDAARRVASGQGDDRRRPDGDAAEVMLIGFQPPSRSVVEDQVSIPARSLVGRALDACSPLVIDPDDGDERAALPPAHGGARTVVAVPLRARGNVLGALVLSSERRAACGQGAVSLLQRVAGTVAVGLENARLFRRISERSAALERANEQQASMLQTIRELSSPVVPIADGILVMPVVGVMDAERSGHFIASMLEQIRAHRAQVVLIDVTGMAVVDTSAASQLVQAARAAALLGAEAVIVGMRPDAARRMIEQGLDVGSLGMQSDLSRGFRYALQRTRGRRPVHG